MSSGGFSSPPGAAVGPRAGEGSPFLAVYRDLGRYWQLACTGHCGGSWRDKGDFVRKSYAEVAKVYGKNKSPGHETVKKELEFHASLRRLGGRGESHNFFTVYCYDCSGLSFVIVVNLMLCLI